jgi:hypothetical protein
MARQAAAMVAVMVSFLFSRLRRVRADLEPSPYGPRSLGMQHRLSTLQMIMNNTDAECLDMLRMKRAAFFALCNVFRVRGLVRETSGCSVEEQVAMFLHIVGHNQRFRVVHQAWRRSIETVSRVFHQVLYAVGEMRAEMIRPPSTTTHPKIMGSPRWFPYLEVHVKLVWFLKVLFNSIKCTYHLTATCLGLCGCH